ncbi:MAG: squalene/phytoene synthase family protein [Acidobacteriota bacterium]|nr:squalene/phytoene synthase family protein [Acidobacteriota bacterium]
MSDDAGGGGSRPNRRSGDSRPDGLVSLLGGSGDTPGSRSSGEGRSVHSSFYDLTPPKADFDAGRARVVCAEIARQLLGEFAPALAVLSATHRIRAQALVAYARTMLDFTSDATLEGERLAQINRWQFALEQAFDGEPAGQPVFIVLADCERESPWPREPLDELAAFARTRIARGRPLTGAELSVEAVRLATTVLAALTTSPLPSGMEALAEAAVRLHSLLGWRESLFHTRPDLGLDASDQKLGSVIAAESISIRALLSHAVQRAEPGSRAGLPAPAARVAHFVATASTALLDRIDDDPDAAHAPRLNALTRLRLVLGARFGPTPR